MSPGVVLLLSASGMIAVGTLASWLWNRGRPGNWPALGIGALAWIIGVSLKLAWAFPTNRHVLRKTGDADRFVKIHHDPTAFTLQCLKKTGQRPRF